jgi:hypothetical protein
MTRAVAAAGAIATTVLPGNLRCDNFPECRSELFGQGNVTLTDDRARARGWHIYPWSAKSTEARHVLCKDCVGRRMRLAPAPETLSGQEELF